jgi:mono/diheme cytochrome c family protein
MARTEMPAARFLLGCALAGFASPLWSAGAAEAARTVLAKNCLACHGQLQTSGLDLRDPAAIRKGGKRGPAVVPGDADQSLLYRAVAHRGDLRMPPGKRLPDEEVAALRSWINEGAGWDDAAAKLPDQTWWAFRPPVKPTVPAVAGARHPIDAFVLAKLHEKQLRPAPLADRRALLRRAYHDLHGLPPAPAEAEAFLADNAPDAWEKLIDRLLASPRYGERWGRHWLDVARYADTGGFETDIYYPNAWRYRDYVIQSFNDDKPYDVFVREQIAGDEIWPDTLELEGSLDIPPAKLRNLEARIGTGLYTIGTTYHEAALFGDQLRYEWQTDAVDTTGKAFLGLTIGCARCHDHKFDPLSQRDYYRLMAIFAGSEPKDIPVVSKMAVFGFQANYPTVLKVEDYRAAIQAIDDRVRKRATDEIKARFSPEVVQAFDIHVQKRTPEQNEKAAPLEEALTKAGLRENASGKEFVPQYTAAEKDERDRLLYELGKATLEARFTVPTATVLGHSEHVPDVHLTTRGDFRPAGPKVGPGFPRVLGGEKDLEEPAVRPFVPQRRKALALWLARPDHPLTARVLVNRVWHWHFGRGIVATPNDFGRQGEPPTHPELLDWLATEFVENGWSIKKLHRLILTSEAYRRSSLPDEANARIDPANRYLWRMNRQRVDAETLRDSMLAVSGSLNLKVGGRPVVPPLTEEEKTGIWALKQWPVTLDPAEHNRRSVYLYVKRSFPYPMFSTFDAPDTAVSCPRRDATTVAPQALALMNSPFAVEQAKRFAARLEKEHPGDRSAQIRAAWELALARPPSDAERERAAAFLEASPLSELCLVLLNMNEFLYVD